MYPVHNAIYPDMSNVSNAMYPVYNAMYPAMWNVSNLMYPVHNAMYPANIIFKGFLVNRKLEGIGCYLVLITCDSYNLYFNLI